MSPLEQFQKVAKDFKIIGNKLLHPRQQIAFVSEQSNQQRQIINRLMYDTAMARTSAEEAKDEMTKAAHLKKVAQFEDDLRQLTKTLDFSMKLEEELSKANPGTEAGEYPEGA